MSAYYNEIDPYAAEWLRNLIKAGHIADGEVNTRSIVDVQPDDIRHFTQCHFFAGIAGWSHAFRLAGWPDDRKVWTGSCPCQPFSVAGKGKGTDDERHLWPHFFRLIRGCRPPVVMGEQVAGAAGYGWLDGVRFDLESEEYTIEGVDIPACSVNAPHIRQRLYWCAVVNSYSERRQEHGGSVSVQTEQPSVECSSSGRKRSWESVGSGSSDMADCTSKRLEGAAGKSLQGHINGSACDGYWHDAIWLNGADRKARRAEPSICLLANGVPARVGKLRAYGNAIVPQVAAEVIKAFMDVYE